MRCISAVDRMTSVLRRYSAVLDDDTGHFVYSLFLSSAYNLGRPSLRPLRFVGWGASDSFRCRILLFTDVLRISLFSLTSTDISVRFPKSRALLRPHRLYRSLFSAPRTVSSTRPKAGSILFSFPMRSRIPFSGQLPTSVPMLSSKRLFRVHIHTVPLLFSPGPFL